jgi:nitrite reductase (NO-forming)
MSTYPSSPPYGEERHVAVNLFALFAGILIPGVLAIGLWMAISAHQAAARATSAARAVATQTAAAKPASASMVGMGGTTTGAGSRASASFAGLAPENADQLAMAHTPFPAALRPAPAGPVARFTLSIEHKVVQIAPGIHYDAWTFGGTVPAPALHVRQGQRVVITLVNKAPMPHSVDFHAAQVAPNLQFNDVMPGKSKTLSFVASVPGVFMYHCGTAPAFIHIANGMYGAIVVEPKNMPPAAKQYVLVSSEWYLDRPGLRSAASLDLTKALNMTPDWMTFNGYAAQYKTHPLTAKPGDNVRFWVVDAGPSINTEFHVVGTVLKDAWINADMVDRPQHDIQTAVVPAGGGGVFDVRITTPGIYPFVSHSFASVYMGEVGLLNVGGVAGTMNH